MSNISTERRDALCSKVIGGRTVAEWDNRWVDVPDWRTVNTPELQGARGIVRFWLKGEVMAIGRASDNCRGIVKKFSDLTRPSPSSRDHHAGRLIYERRYELTADIIITAEKQEAEHINIALKGALVELYSPAWLASKSM